jgi:hypothetical protein
MYTYEVIENIIKRTDQEGIITWIPIEPANSDYQEYLASLDEASTL